MRESVFLVLLLGLFLIAPLAAQDEGAESNAEVAGNDAVAETADALPGGDESSEQADDGDESPEYADDLNDFIPSSEVPPDEQLTFPVDI